MAIHWRIVPRVLAMLLLVVLAFGVSGLHPSRLATAQGACTPQGPPIDFTEPSPQLVRVRSRQATLLLLASYSFFYSALSGFADPLESALASNHEVEILGHSIHAFNPNSPADQNWCRPTTVRSHAAETYSRTPWSVRVYHDGQLVIWVSVALFQTNDNPAINPPCADAPARQVGWGLIQYGGPPPHPYPNPYPGMLPPITLYCYGNDPFPTAYRSFGYPDWASTQQALYDIILFVLHWYAPNVPGFTSAELAAAIASVPQPGGGTVAFPPVSPGGDITPPLASSINQQNQAATLVLDYGAAISTAFGRYATSLQMGDQPSADMQKNQINEYVQVLGFAGTALAAAMNALADTIPGTPFDLTLPLDIFRVFLDAPCECKPTVLPASEQPLFNLFGLDPQAVLDFMPGIDPTTVPLNWVDVLHGTGSALLDVANTLLEP